MRRLIPVVALAILCSCNGLDQQTKSISSIPKRPAETTDGIVYFSSNNGLTWENKSDGLPDSINIGLGAIAVSDQSLGIATKEHGIFLFDFQMSQWMNIPVTGEIVESNPGPMIFFKDQIYLGTQTSGVFLSVDLGHSWERIDEGLENLTIRRFVEMDNKLYAGTNGGLYYLNEIEKKWVLEYGNNTMQVNGMTMYKGSIYIATNQAAFANSTELKVWEQVLADRTLHNISADEHAVYVMTYNELLSSTDGGLTWASDQDGLPPVLYTFNVIKSGNSAFAGQWDGVYRKDSPHEDWKSFSSGLPDKLAITNMKVYKGMIVVSGSERMLKTELNTRE